MNVLCLICFIAVAVYVNAEICTVNGNCTSTFCGIGFHVLCQHPLEAGVTTNGGLCTCAQDDFSCREREDCLQPTVILECITPLHRHCYDGKCICTRWAK